MKYIFHAQSNINQVREYVARDRARREEIDFDFVRNPRNRRWQRQLWSNYVPQEVINGEITRLRRYPLNVALTRRRALPNCLLRLIRTLLWWHGPDTLIVIKELISEPDCGRQDEHVDCSILEEHRRVPVSVRQYSALVALESGTTIDICEGIEYHTVPVPTGRMIMWDAGRCHHAGSNYTKRNSRLFISVASRKFPISEDVGIFLDQPDAVRIDGETEGDSSNITGKKRRVSVRLAAQNK